jgi:hypothetical protein
MSKNKHITIFFEDGDPNGRLFCKLSCTNCEVYKIPRTHLKLCKNQEEFNKIGIYFLFGKDDESRDAVYIGEAENVFTRLKQHEAEKEFWNEVIFVYSSDGTLDKAKIKYLENNLYNIAKESNRYIIFNKNEPTIAKLTKISENEMNEFIDFIKLIIKPLGYNVFEPLTIINKEDKTNVFEEFCYKGKDWNASGYRVDGGFIVLKGSKISNEIRSEVKEVKTKITKLRENNINKINNSVLTENILFNSPSAASVFVSGSQNNGLTSWKNSDGKTLSEAENDSLS